MNALKSANAHLRGAPQDFPFILDADTLRRGLNFTFATEAGNLDLLGEVQGVGRFDEAKENAETLELFGYVFQVLSLPKLIAAKRSAGRNKDLLVLPELEAIYEYRQSQSEENAAESHQKCSLDFRFGLCAFRLRQRGPDSVPFSELSGHNLYSISASSASITARTTSSEDL